MSPAPPAAIPAAARQLTATSQRPGLQIAAQVGVRAARSGCAWGVVFAIYVAVQALAYVAAYRTQAARDQLAQALAGNVGVNALIGPARSINSTAGYLSWRALGVLSLLGGIWGLLTSTRLVRGEEESGRFELLLAGQTSRRRAAVQQAAGLGLGLLSLFAVTAVGTIATGLTASVHFALLQSMFFALCLVGAAAMFLAVGMLSSQLANTRRRAAVLASAFFGAAYLLRMVADSATSLHWLVWLSPLGWIEEARPLTDSTPAALLPALAVTVLATLAAVRLAAARDVGAATLPDRDSAPANLRLLDSQLAFTLRLIRPVSLGWLVSVAVFSLLLGSIAQSAASAVRGDTAIVQVLQRLGGHGALAAAYLGLTFLVVAFLIAMVAAGQITAIRDEEADGRLDNLLMRPLTRTRWLMARLAPAVGVLVAAGLVAGVCAWFGAASQHAGIGFGALFEAGLNVIPPSVFLLGLGVLAFGGWPRHAAAVTYGYLTWAFLLEFIGAVVHASHWLLDTSVFFHVAPAPASSPNWSSAGAVVGVGVLAATIGVVLFRRRDVTGC